MNLKRINKIGFKSYLAELVISKAEKYLKKVELREQKSLKKKWEELFTTNNTSILHELPGFKSKIHLYKDSELCELIFHGFEKSEINFIQNQLNPGDYFIDIGANIGLFSIIAGERVGQNGKVFSFEPNEEVFHRLERNIKENQMEERVHAFNLGLSDKEEKLNFIKYGYERDAWNSFAVSENDDVNLICELDVIPLPNLISLEDFKKVRIVKIDVEGWERNVLIGMSAYLNLHKPILIVEFTDTNFYKAGYTSFDLYNLIVSYGYEAYEIFGGVPVKSSFKGNYPYNNLIFKNAQDLSF